MKKNILFTAIAMVIFSVSAFAQSSTKLVSTKSHIQFFSTTPAEDIEAHNTSTVSTINTTTGEVVFSVPMQGFEFKKALMQKHYNSSKFLDTKTHPKAKLKGTIANLGEINFAKDGSYSAVVKGELTLKGITKPIAEKGTITVSGTTVKVESKFDITLSDYGVTFTSGKPSSNIAKTVQISLQAEYLPHQ